jgi:hypothetical protein
VDYLKKAHSNKKTIFTYLLVCMLNLSAFNAFGTTIHNTNPVPNDSTFIQFNTNYISKVKNDLHSGKATKNTQKAYQHLISQAEHILNLAAPTVVNKKFFPPSKNKHDYLSISRYWWPDPNTKDGLPWIRKDGITNPDTQTDDVDRKRFGRLTKSIKILSLAYYFSDDEKYAIKGISFISTWFLDDQTKMNPHLKYAQSVPGNPNSRRSGILDGRIIPETLLDALTFFSSSPNWTNEKNTKMNLWLNQYLNWLTTSKLGKAGAKQKNNHGSWYRFQVAALAWYLKKETLLKSTVLATQHSLSEQFNDQGAQPHELKRTRAFFYSCFNLKALTRIATIANKAGLSLWEYQSAQGHSLKLAIDYLMPVVRGEKWPHASKNIDLSRLAELLGELVAYNNNPEYKHALKKILNDLASHDQLTAHQQAVLYEFALLKPDLM